MESERVGGIAGAVDTPVAASQGLFDVAPLDGLERLRFGRVAARGRRACRGVVELEELPRERISARSITFSSSRTLPGQLCPCSASITAGSIVSIRRFSCRCRRSMKHQTSRGMSSRRSRSGGR